MTIIFPSPKTPTIEPSYGRSLAVPPIVSCPVFDIPPWIGPSLGNGWNCNRCGSDDKFYSVWKDGDIIPFQINAPDEANGSAINPSCTLRASSCTACV